MVSYWRKGVHLVPVNRLGSLPRNSVVRLTNRLDMTIVVDWGVKPQIKQKIEIDKIWKSSPDTTKIANGLVRLIRMDETTRR